jgi:hypothetical protein
MRCVDWIYLDHGRGQRRVLGMGAKSITLVRAVTADFFFNCRAAEVLLDE